MKFSCSTALLDQQLAYVSRIITVRQSVPVLSNVLMEVMDGKIRLSGSDIDLAITTSLPANISEEGSFTVPAKVLQEFVHQNPDDEIQFSLESYELVCRSTKVEGRISGMDADEYPPLPQVSNAVKVVLPLQGFVEALKQVVIACAHDQSRPVLTGIYMVFNEGRLTLAATDSFRLVERHLPITPVEAPMQCVVPSRVIQEIIRIAGTSAADAQLSFEVADQQLLLTVGTVELYTRLITGNFPKYQAIIPATFIAKIQVTTNELIQALRMSYVFSQSGVSNVVLSLDEGGTLTISSYGSQKGSTKNTLYTVPEEGFQAVDVPFNAKFLLDACQATGAPCVTFFISGVTTALMITCDTPDYLQLVMPIRRDH